MDEPIMRLQARMDQDQAWAEGCQGHHWVWERTEGDEVAEPNPAEEESLADGDTVALRSVEQKTVDYASWTLSATTPISHAEEVMSAAAGHIQRHDPARVLQDVEALRKVIDCWPDPFGNWSAEQAEAARAMKAAILRLLAEPAPNLP